MSQNAKEAKEILRRRYGEQGYHVKRVTHRGDHFGVYFGENEEGLGLGPSGLVSISCNWPTKDPGVQGEFQFERKKRKRIQR